MHFTIFIYVYDDDDDTRNGWRIQILIQRSVSALFFCQHIDSRIRQIGLFFRTKIDLFWHFV